MALDTVRGPSPASRKIRRLGISVAVIVALYSAGWFYVASKIEETVRNFIARPGPVELACDGLTRTGTPFRIGFACDRTSVKDDATGGMLSTGAIHAVANIYNPGSAIVELDGPADVSLLGGTAITANWSLLRSGFSLGFSGLKTLSNTGENLSLDLFSYAMVEPIVAKAKHGEFHIRGNGADVDVAVLADDFALATKSGAEILPMLSTSTELTLKDKAELLEGKPLLSKAMTGTLTSFKIATPQGLYGEMSGPFEIDEKGYISGTFKTRLEKLGLWEANLLKLFPKADNTISGMAALFKGLAKGGDTVTVNLVVDKGTITLSMFPLGHIPPL
ncbi:DUF2125 domain-containing protein [Rhizobium sp. TH2]|uniref:DUF2125 domain-containing protein n=1 Tax=Rhizobium sp. TH2 TaxID=2775403 RepID=UPI00215847B0|nr:DUF2125 domain-containing protein [Rhizobium sp. TH2]UVC08290.1 DUF2125 domain-containing protein [Rhizobium sp. TH2]